MKSLVAELDATKRLWEISDDIPQIKELLQDDERNATCMIESEGIIFDYSHTWVNKDVIDCLLEIAKEMGVDKKIKAKFDG